MYGSVQCGARFWVRLCFVQVSVRLKFKHELFSLDYTESSKTFIDAFSKAWMLAFCGHTWWRKPKNPGENDQPWTGDHGSVRFGVLFHGFISLCPQL